MKDCKEEKHKCLNIGMKAPDFCATTTFGSIRLSDFRGKWVILFSHPGDFTPVCTTEFIGFAQCYPYFKKRNVQLLGLSIDSNPSHLAWVYSIYKNTGIQIPFPIIADRDGSISRMYGMVSPYISSTETVRSVFIIDENGIIRTILTYPLTNGRNIGEILRMVCALQTTDEEKVVTPANWIPGCPVMVPPPKTYNELINRRKDNPELCCIDWYWCYKKQNKNFA
ncbi:peroxiredoxin [Clostridium tetani]|uniref:peroxiredoxin n=1 Tax=Clostridium tetani TaxID=1513 RepID=UPI000D20D018|nr:peroxiredoxin [Clostridium tetani]AVP55094.1 peroxiredoxin [Clostridium tetani]RXI52587.1 peroxiredoxin [Clostridium tetani]RXI56825.1 peroxiredoxin [Clostridium tetani]RXI74508.1 peroxiredoxin [Clostridium tetani]RXM76662.1 peroxiredoxin [Clostridium tetani]